jgi:hypothetical protein
LLSTVLAGGALYPFMSGDEKPPISVDQPERLIVWEFADGNRRIALRDLASDPERTAFAAAHIEKALGYAPGKVRLLHLDIRNEDPSLWGTFDGLTWDPSRANAVVAGAGEKAFVMIAPGKVPRAGEPTATGKLLADTATVAAEIHAGYAITAVIAFDIGLEFSAITSVTVTLADGTSVELKRVEHTRQSYNALYE